MENNAWKDMLAQNLSRLRREKGMTQAELGEKLNYSDKSVSKWERGEGVPDLMVMMQLCRMYDVTLNDFVGQEKEKQSAPETNKKDRIIGHSVLIVTVESAIWLVALIVFFVLSLTLPEHAKCWLAFIYALPVSFSGLGVCFLCWRSNFMALVTLSAALWTVCLSINLTANPAYAGIIYAIGGFVQLTALIIVSAFVYRSRHVSRKT